MKNHVMSLVLVCSLFGGVAGAAQIELRADPARSKFHIELGTAGFLKFMGDEHLIAVNDYQCKVKLDEQNPAQSSVKLAVKTASLKVMDPNLAADKRAEVQKTMEGPKVLDVSKHPEITFESKKVTQSKIKIEGQLSVHATALRLEGDLTIRGVTRPAVFDVTLEDEQGGVRRARGMARVKQTQFEIEPVTAGGGSVKVKDEMKIVFDLVLVPAGR